MGSPLLRGFGSETPFTGFASGLESGFKIGQSSDDAAERKRHTKFEENRQLEQDKRAENEGQRREARESRLDRRMHEAERQGAQDRAHKYLEGRQKELTGAATRAQETGGPIPDDVAQEYGQNAASLARIRQDSLNYFSRLQAGQADLDSTSPKDLYMHTTAALGRPPEDLPQMRQGIEDVQAGLETKNQGLLLQGMNTMLAPSLKKGIGGPSPHGGTIVRKEIIGLDPARSADGADHPDKFIPRLRVYVKGDDGKEKYYDAPVTQNRSTDPNDKVVAVGMSDAMDFLGNMGVMVEALGHPEVQAKLQEGAQAAGPDAKKYLDELYAATKPNKKTTTTENVSLPADSGETVRITKDVNGKEVSREVIKHNAKPFRPPGGGGGAKGALQAKLDAIDAGVQDGTFEEDDAAAMKKAVLAGIKPGTGKASKGPSNAELNANETKALDAVAGNLGLEYDPLLKTYKNRDGTPATAEQKDRVAKAKEAINKTSRDAAAKSERTTGSDLVEAGKAAAGAKAKYTEGQTATGPGGKKLVFKGGAWQPVQ